MKLDAKHDDRSRKKERNNLDFQLWRQDNHPIELSTLAIAHLHYNPVVAGFVDKPEEYLYSSARDYYGGKGLINITLLDTQVVTV